MTIITKAIGEKKIKTAGDNLQQPLVPGVDSTTSAVNQDPEAQRPKGEFVVRQRYLILSRDKIRHKTVTTLCLFLTAMLVVTVGVTTGVYLYRLYSTDMDRFQTSWYSIPYDSASNPMMMTSMMLPLYTNRQMPQSLVSDSDLFKSLRKSPDELAEVSNYFKERFEIDLQNEYYEKIDVPDFRGGRRGRFIHDFNSNKTGIVDIDGKCCFVMPLNRQRVLPPLNMYDLLKKMYNGYYEVDTEIVRETMTVVTPALTDLSTVGAYIARECQNMPTYMLQPVGESIFKRSANDGVYGLFAGKNILELDILNLPDFINNNNANDNKKN